MINDNLNPTSDDDGVEGRPFKMLCQDKNAGPDLAADKRISDFDRRMMLWLIKLMNKSNIVRRRQEELAEIVGVSGPRISASLNSLARAGFVTMPHQAEIHVSPYIAWNNSRTYMTSARKRFDMEYQRQLAKIHQRDERRLARKVGLLDAQARC